MDARARSLEHRAHERDGGTLAVGAGDVDDGRQPALRMAKLLQQSPDAIEREVDQLGMQRQEPRNDRVDFVHGRGADEAT